MTSIAEFVNNRAEARAYVPEEPEEKKVTVRLDVRVVQELDTVAGQLGYTRSGLAAELLSCAVREAYKAADGHPLLTTGIPAHTIAQIADEEEAIETLTSYPERLTDGEISVINRIPSAPARRRNQIRENDEAVAAINAVDAKYGAVEED